MRARMGREPILVVTGGPDVGRTLWRRSLALRRDARTFVALVSTPPASSEDLLINILDEFGVLSPARSADSGVSRLTLRRVLYQFLAVLERLDARAVVVVDDAQRMAAEGFEELRALTECDGATGELLQIVLVGGPGLHEHLALLSLQDPSQRATGRATRGAAPEAPASVEPRLPIASEPGEAVPGVDGRRRRDVAVAAVILIAAVAGGSWTLGRREGAPPADARAAVAAESVAQPGPDGSTGSAPVTNEAPAGAALAVGTDEEIRARADALSRVPDVRALLRLREVVAARSDRPPDQDARAELLRAIDGSLDAARRLQLDVDRQLLEQAAGAAPSARR